MTSVPAPPPTLFGSASASPQPATSAADAGRHAPSLADLLYDGFYLVFLLRSGKGPRDAEAFRKSIVALLTDFERNAKREGFEAEDIYDAKYAFCATVDEAILSSRYAVRDDWERRPLQLSMFGDQLAGEAFFDKLEEARNVGKRRLPALEVFHMCLLLGFKGRYMLEGQEKHTYLTAQLGDQIAHIKGKRAPFAPHWAAPDQVSHTLRRVLPVWVVAATLALFGLLAYIGIKHHLDDQTRLALADYNNLVSMPPRAPHVVITLP